MNPIHGFVCSVSMEAKAITFSPNQSVHGAVELTLIFNTVFIYCVQPVHLIDQFQPLLIQNWEFRLPATHSPGREGIREPPVCSWIQRRRTWHSVHWKGDQPVTTLSQPGPQIYRHNYNTSTVNIIRLRVK